MENCFAREVYFTLQGLLTPEAQVPGVEDLFETGKPCNTLYAEIHAAYGRLCTRLGASDEDEDVEIILHNMSEICRILSLKMYEYGTICNEKPQR